MSLEPEFLADCPYLAEGVLLDEIALVDRDQSRVVARMPTHADLPLTRTQRVHPKKHPRHINGGLMVHMTGIVGFVHAYYVLDLRHADGWTGYGGSIKSARYKALATVGPPIHIACQAARVRKGKERIIAQYAFEFTQGDTVVYTSQQTAMFMRVIE